MLSLWKPHYVEVDYHTENHFFVCCHIENHMSELVFVLRITCLCDMLEYLTFLSSFTKKKPQIVYLTRSQYIIFSKVHRISFFFFLAVQTWCHIKPIIINLITHGWTVSNDHSWSRSKFNFTTVSMTKLDQKWTS